MKYKILRIDQTHEILDRKLKEAGFHVDVDLVSGYDEIKKKIFSYNALIVRSRIPVDKELLSFGKKLKCIVRVGSGLEGIDLDFAKQSGIKVFNTPEGNANAVGEMTLGLLLDLVRNITHSFDEIKQGKWQRRVHTGFELEGKTVAIIGYGNTGKAFARKLRGVDVEVLFYDIVPGKSDSYAREASMEEIFRKADVVSLHIPLTEKTKYLVNTSFINNFSKSFWLLNTSRGEVVKTVDLLRAIENNKILGAALDVLEYENKAFGDMEINLKENKVLQSLIMSNKVILTPHIAGLTHESYRKLAEFAAEKIITCLKS